MCSYNFRTRNADCRCLLGVEHRGWRNLYAVTTVGAHV